MYVSSTMRCLVKIVPVIFLIHIANGFQIHRIKSVHPTELEESRDVTEGYIRHDLDHFHDENPNSWEQSVYMNMKYSGLKENKTNFPIFIYVTGGWDNIDPTSFLRAGLMYEIGKKVGAMLLSIEFRMYGKSQATVDLDVKNLRYLNIEQGLEDLRMFFKNFKDEEATEKSKIILFGNNFGGSVAVWLKQKYPKLVHGVWASNAILNVQPEFPDVYAHVGNTIKLIDKKCYKIIKKGFKELKKPSDDNQRIFNTCSDVLLDEINWSYFLHILAESITEFMVYASTEMVSYLCSDEIRPGDSNIDNLAKFVDSLYDGNCIDVDFDKFVVDLKNKTYDEHSVNRQIFWQQCTEFGWMTTSNEKSIFGQRFILQDFTDLCTEIFGGNFRNLPEIVKSANEKHNGPFPSVENVIFTVSEYDPWSMLGVSPEVNGMNGNTVWYVKGYGRYWDMLQISKFDTPELVNVKNEVAKTIEQWVSKTKPNKVEL